MPFLIDPRKYTDNDISWEDVWPKDKQTNAYVSLGKRNGQTTALEGPIPYRFGGGKLLSADTLPDVLPGRWSRNMFVSERVKQAICALDRVSHNFIPLELDVKGTILKDTHFLFTTGDLTDAIIAEKSDVLPNYVESTGKLGFYSTPSKPQIVWKQTEIEGRAIWVDRYLSSQFFISGDLLQMLKDLGAGRFQAIPSFAE
ncbi:imm11 family protein [Tateyamaria sp. SN6-1]|uniref:imm11 family protein n=1 Tax=Tateyamaria sp. SN6-1 TaxID=3092148 RepID=UPI0039F62A78